MGKRTKAQKKRLVAAVEMKTKELWLEGLVSTKALESVERMCKSAYSRLK